MKNFINSFIIFMVGIGFFLLPVSVLAQQQKVSGTVVDAVSGDPLPGATIRSGAGSGAISGGEGRFSLSVSKGDTIRVTVLGYDTKKLVYSGQEDLTIQMGQSSHQLDQLVVVGYGKQSRSTISNSVAKMSDKVLQDVPRANIGSALQGSLPGLQVTNSTGQPGATPKVLLRGGASINSPGGPLVVVDGVISSYNDIPAEDIKSVQLLKDAAATAIYGARANNGVLLITTKSGSAGKAKITYKYTLGFNQARKGYDFMDAHDFIYYNRLGDKNSGRSLSDVNAANGYGLRTDSAYLSTFDIREYNSKTKHLLGEGWDTVGDPYGGTIIFKDHSGEVKNLVFRNTKTQDHYLRATGGNDKGQYYTSFDYYKEDGIIVGSEYKRFSGDVKGSYKIKPNLKVSSGIKASTSGEYGANANVINTMYRTLSLWPTFNPWINGDHSQPNPGNGITDGNPLYWLNKHDRKADVNRITANASVKWDIIPGLYIKGTGSGYYFENLNQSFWRATKTYSQIFTDPPSTGDVSREASANYQRAFQQQYDVIAGYNKSFGKHNFNLMLGAEYFDNSVFQMQVLGTKSPTDDIPTVNASTVFNPNSSSNVVVNGLNNNYSMRTDYRIISQFGRLNYDYDQRYLLTLTFRRDGVSSLPNGNRFGFFPGMSAGWNIQKEKFWQNSSISNVISTLKPRISYGVNGNVAGLGRYEVQGVYGLQGSYNGQSGFLNTAMVNSNLGWEKSKTIDVGLDFGLFGDRVSAVLDYYNRKTSDLLTNLSLPSYTGYSSIRTNLGTFQNKGFEVSVTANILNQPNGLRWDVSANASYNENKILKLPPNGQPNNRQGGFQIYDPKKGKLVWVGGYQEGQTLGSVYAFKELGIFKDQDQVNEVAGNRVDLVAGISGPNSNYGSGDITPGDVNWKDVDQNDTIDVRDQVYIGNINPKWTGGFSTTLAYKGFTFYARFQFATGYVIYNDYVARILGNYQGTFNYLEKQKNAWSPSNRNTDIPKVYYADQVSAPLGKKNYTRVNNAGRVLNSNNSNFYENGSYLAGREFTLSYDFSEGLLSHTRVLKSARLFFTANNLFYITQFSGPTPEPPTTVPGVYTGTYPTPRSYVVGVKISF